MEVASATPTLLPTATSVAVSNSDECWVTPRTFNVNLREGPGIGYPINGYVLVGDARRAIGQNGGWFFLREGKWISGYVTDETGPCDQLLYRQAPELPTPEPTVQPTAVPQQQTVNNSPQQQEQPAQPQPQPEVQPTAEPTSPPQLVCVDFGINDLGEPGHSSPNGEGACVHGDWDGHVYSGFPPQGWRIDCDQAQNDDGSFSCGSWTLWPTG